MQGFDIIGDIHGHADALRRLLEAMGYLRHGDVYRHPTRTFVFAGDFVDRGPLQRETLHIARAMVEAGTARAVMGNHEFNAIAYATPEGEGGLVRPRTEKTATSIAPSSTRSAMAPPTTRTRSHGSRRCRCGSTSAACGWFMPVGTLSLSRL